VLEPGSVVDGRYEILAPLGAGGMGQVFRARRVRLGDEVAFKVLPPGELGGAATERFLRESRACAQLRHPHIVSILDFDLDGSGRPYLVMELLSGPTLREELDLGGAFAPRPALAILDAVAGAIQLAHDHGITHRDLKPANIVAHVYGGGDRVYKVIDFGLAALAQSSDATRLTQPFTFLGTMAYAAPEQLAGETVGPPADQYALGVIAYELLTGRRPFDLRDPMALARHILAAAAAPPSTLRPALAAADAVILRALARRPEERWPSVAAFAEALQEMLGRAAGESAPPGAAAPIDEPGLLARYDVGEVLGPGRLGSVVRRGTHRALGVPVAIRHLKREGQPHWDALRDRFLLEARTLQVRHPHLLQVRDFGEDAAGVFVVTDLIDGPSLREAAGAAPLAWPRARRLILQMTDAAEALHAHGGLLTGVNPGMIRLTGGSRAEQIVMSTGGIRALADVLATMREQQLRGQESTELELPYVAPEVLTGRAPDARADVFAIAAIAAFLLTGRAPFQEATLPELIGRMLMPGAAVLPAPDGVPTAAWQAIGRCLAADPAARGTVADLRERVRDAVGD
jgi:serine/threonine protein kinase